MSVLPLFKFKGGVKPETHKTPSVQLPIASAPLPPLLVVPLHQNIGGPSLPLVKPGDQVRKGQRIGAMRQLPGSCGRSSRASPPILRDSPPFRW